VVPFSRLYPLSQDCIDGVVSFGKNSATPPAEVPAAHVVSCGLRLVAGVTRAFCFVPTYREKFDYTPCWRSPIRAQFQRESGSGVCGCGGGMGPRRRVRTWRVAVWPNAGGSRERSGGQESASFSGVETRRFRYARSVQTILLLPNSVSPSTEDFSVRHTAMVKRPTPPPPFRKLRGRFDRVARLQFFRACREALNHLVE